MLLTSERTSPCRAPCARGGPWGRSRSRGCRTRTRRRRWARGWGTCRCGTSALPHQTKHRTSPPTRRLRASRSERRPWLVDRTAVPRPPSTRGTSVALEYTRRPGLDTRRMPEMVRARSGLYFMAMTSTLPGLPGFSSTLKPSMKPSFWRMAARASFTLEDGMRTSSCIATLALRMRVSMSAIGSVMVMSRRLPSPAGLGHARELAGMGELAQADPAQAELAEHGMRSPTAPAPGVRPDLELGLALLLVDERLLRHAY